MPCNLKTSFMNTKATLVAKKGWDKGKKCTYFVSLSTTTKKNLIPYGNIDKNNLMSTQGLIGMESCCNNPVGFDVSTLILWHVSQHLIWDLTFDFIPSKKNLVSPYVESSNTLNDLQVVSHACAIKPEALKESTQKDHSLVQNNTIMQREPFTAVKEAISCWYFCSLR